MESEDPGSIPGSGHIAGVSSCSEVACSLKRVRLHRRVWHLSLAATPVAGPTTRPRRRAEESAGATRSWSGPHESALPGTKRLAPHHQGVPQGHWPGSDPRRRASDSSPAPRTPIPTRQDDQPLTPITTPRTPVPRRQRPQSIPVAGVAGFQAGTRQASLGAGRLAWGR